ncbi:SPOR domain-containing protein [Pseudooceanicola nanhaiensis]|uniref:SPOR domain-containing protein n=1 Tax=Pseudooceanicola nanhaiensis TaxID=375761 RepID=UPI001CD6EB7A|nr:SPOR domain-containing protein [Pseudooceanicola nanhaiensis]MCA0919771.1 SPOR domain-containing protein [Pseudooceanicola nanhaiensis]
MAEYQADGAYEAPRGVSVQTMVNWMGAAASVALVAGIGYWGYKMVMRDVSGVPVVKAMEGEMRVAPEDPGGQPAAHQGLAVNAIAADGVAEKPADTLRLAPKAMTLRAEDVPTGAIPSEETRALAAASEPKPDANRMASIQALADRLAQGAAPLSGLRAGTDPATNGPAADATVADAAGEEPEVIDLTEGGMTAADAGIDAQTIVAETQEQIAEVVASSDADTPEEKALALALATAAAEQTLEEEEKEMNTPQEGAVSHSLRPKTRPVQLASVMASATSTMAAEPEAAEAAEAPVVASGGLDVAAGDVPPGTRLAQLGAFESAEVARSEWDRLNGRFSEFLDGKQRVIQRAQSGGRTFYRLRAMGFEDLADARRFCAAFVAEKSDCIPVVSK